MPDVYYSERNLLEAAREGKQITEAEIQVLVDRLVRLRQVSGRYRGTLQAIAQYVDVERTPQGDWILDRIQEAFDTATSGSTSA